MSPTETKQRDRQLKQWLQSMDEYEFEHFVADIWEKRGYNAEVSQASIDQGIDVVATRETPYPQKELIQAKRYGSNTTVGSPEIQQYNSLKQQESGVDAVIIVTTNGFSSQAKELADQLNVKLVDGDALIELIKRENLFGVVYSYLEVPQLDELTRDDIPDALVEEIRSEVRKEVETQPSPEQSQTVEQQSPGADTERLTADSMQEEIPETAGDYDVSVEMSTSTPATTERVETDAFKTKWYYGVLGGLGMWLLALFGSSVFPSSVVGLLAFAGWCILPLATYFDSSILKENLGEGLNFLYVGAALVPFLNLFSAGVYLVQRHRLLETVQEAMAQTPAPDNQAEREESVAQTHSR